MTHNQQPNALTYTRRLLSTEETATKIGRSLTTFNRKYKELRSDGFPEPVFGGGRGASKLWDERAIDLWLDAKMPHALQTRAAAAQDHRHAADSYKTTALLTDRAQTLHI